MNKKLASALLGLAFLLAACGPVSPTPDGMMDETPTLDEMMDETPTQDSMMDETPADDGMMDETPTEESMNGSMMDAPAWYGVAFTDAASGDKFTIAGFSGKVVLVETMAVWCTNCMAQQRQIQALHENIGMRADLVTLSLDIDPNEDIQYLGAFAASNGFDWLYAVAGPDVAREIGLLYGDQFLSPPSTPMLIIDRQGKAHLLPFGIKNAEELQNYLQPYLDAGM